MINLTHAADDLNDEALIRAIKRMNDPEQDPNRFDSCSDGEDGEDEALIKKPVAAPVDKDMERIQRDISLRHHLKLGSKFTGPKGVKQDYDFHKKQERARKHEKEQKDYKKRSNAALSSGWLQRSIEEEESKGKREEEEFMKQYRQKRIAELTRASHAATFGSVVYLNFSSYVQCIDGESPDVKILIHLYDSTNLASRLCADFFSSLAHIYKKTKFCQIPVFDADPDFDVIGLPAVLVYKAGALDISLIRIVDEIPGWANSNRCSLRDFEEYLILQDVLDQDQHRFQGYESEDSEISDH